MPQPDLSRKTRYSVALLAMCLLSLAVLPAYAWPGKHHRIEPTDQKPLKAGKITMSSLEAAPKEITPQRWEELEAANANVLKDFNLQTAFPNKDWWRNFKDPNLEEYIDQALMNNRDLKVANLRVRQAQATMQQVRAALLPTLDAQGRYSRQRVGGAAVNSTSLPGGGTLTGGSLVNAAQTSASGTPNTSFNLYSVPLVATYEVDPWGKNRMKYKSARLGIDQQQQLARAMALNISTQVATAYLNMLRMDAQIETSQALLDNAKKTMTIQQLLFQSGIVSYDGLLITAEDIANYQQNLTQAQGQLGVYTHQLMQLRGQPPVASEHIQRAKLEALQFPGDIPTGVPSELITHRPDVVAGEIAMKQSYVNVSEARREFLPTMNIVGSFGFASRELSQLFDWKSWAGSLIGVLDQSLFAGGAKVANLRLQKSLALQQIQNYQGTLLRAFQQVEDSMVTLKADYGGYQQNLEAIALSEKAVKLTEIRYKNGISPRLDTLTARRQLLQFQQVANQNKASSLIDLVNLYSALGGGYTP
jgi:NodT family efflux transporter outer membrane factor (OMF) lipoprotein